MSFPESLKAKLLPDIKCSVNFSGRNERMRERGMESPRLWNWQTWGDKGKKGSRLISVLLRDVNRVCFAAWGKPRAAIVWPFQNSMSGEVQIWTRFSLIHVPVSFLLNHTAFLLKSYPHLCLKDRHSPLSPLVQVLKRWRLAVWETITKSLVLFVFTMLQLNHFNEAQATNTSQIF